MAAALPPLLIAAERLASTITQGVHSRRKAGMGETFWQFRRYRDGDPSAVIDWRQSAKTQHLYVREREWEAAESIWIWRDASPGMHFSSPFSRETKYERATLLALACASLLVRGGERIAVLGEGTPAAGGRLALRRVARALSHDASTAAALPPAAALPKFAQVLWVSDFLSPLAEIEEAALRFARAGVTGHLMCIADPAEEEFPFEGRIRFEAVAGSEHTTLGRAEGVREDYRHRYRAQNESVRNLARRLGWTHLFHRTDRPARTALVALYAALAGVRGLARR